MYLLAKYENRIAIILDYWLWFDYIKTKANASSADS